MREYQFFQRCHPKGSVRAAHVAQFVKLMSEAFDVRFWTHRGQRIDTDESAIQPYLQSLIDPQMPGAGISLVLASHHEENPILIMIATGADEWGREFFDVDFSQRRILPDLLYFRRSIILCTPFEAFIADKMNELDLNSYERQRRFPNFERPAIVRWFHYISSGIVDTLGGVEYCMNTPAFKTEQFCEGVLLQLTETPFDPNNPLHKDIQFRAMNHLRLG